MTAYFFDPSAYVKRCVRERGSEFVAFLCRDDRNDGGLDPHVGPHALGPEPHVYVPGGQRQVVVPAERGVQALHVEPLRTVALRHDERDGAHRHASDVAPRPVPPAQGDHPERQVPGHALVVDAARVMAPVRGPGVVGRRVRDDPVPGRAPCTRRRPTRHTGRAAACRGCTAARAPTRAGARARGTPTGPRGRDAPRRARPCPCSSTVPSAHLLADTHLYCPISSTRPSRTNSTITDC